MFGDTRKGYSSQYKYYVCNAKKKRMQTTFYSKKALEDSILQELCIHVLGQNWQNSTPKK